MSAGRILPMGGDCSWRGGWEPAIKTRIEDRGWRMARLALAILYPRSSILVLRCPLLPLRLPQRLRKCLHRRIDRRPISLGHRFFGKEQRARADADGAGLEP